MAHTIEEHGEPECAVCGLLSSDCVCCSDEPTAEELELGRQERLLQVERRGLVLGGGASRWRS